MPKITIDMQDVEQVLARQALRFSKLELENAALTRRLEELEDAASQGKGQEDDKPEHQGDEEGGTSTEGRGGSGSQDGRRPQKAQARK